MKNNEFTDLLVLDTHTKNKISHSTVENSVKVTEIAPLEDELRGLLDRIMLLALPTPSVHLH